MLTAKLVAFMFARVLRVKLEGVVLEPVVELEPLEVVVLGEACGVMVMDCGRVMPRLRIFSRLTWRMIWTMSPTGPVETATSFRQQELVGGGAEMMAF
jgi:hypothetical protein